MNGKLPSRSRKHHNPVLRRIQQAVARNTKPVHHQIMEAETRAKKQSMYEGGELERNGWLKQVPNEELSKRVASRLTQVKHDKHTFRQIITRRGKKRLRNFRFFRMKDLEQGFFRNPRDLEDLKILNAHRTRVMKILDGKSPPIEIFDAMIPLFEYARKRGMVQQSRVLEMIHLLKNGIKPPKSFKKSHNPKLTLTRIADGYAQFIQKTNTRIAWLSRMAGRAEKGIDVSGAADHFIREINDNLVDHFVTD